MCLIAISIRMSSFREKVEKLRRDKPIQVSEKTSLISVKELVSNWDDKIAELFSADGYGTKFNIILKRDPDKTINVYFNTLVKVAPKYVKEVKFTRETSRTFFERFKMNDQKKRKRKDTNNDVPADLKCEVCEQGHDFDDPSMLICDGCSMGYHYQCLNLDSIPETTDWFCDVCMSSNKLVKFVCQNEIMKSKNSLTKQINHLDSKIDTLLTEINKIKEDMEDNEFIYTKQGSKKKRTLIPSPKITYNRNDTSDELGVKKCFKCKESKATNLSLTLLKDLMTFNQEPLKDTRKFEAYTVHKELLLKKRVCTNITCTASLDISQIHKCDYCMLCRAVRTTKASATMCETCRTTLHAMRKNHAETKKPFEIAMSVCSSTCRIIKSIEFYPEDRTYSNWNTTGDNAVDMIMKITLDSGITLLYVIEFQNTHKESADVLTHKFLSATSKMNPYKSFLMCVRISSSAEWTLLERIDILRRWIILTCYFHSVFPSKTYWEFFTNKDSHIKNGGNSLSEFLKHPISVNNAPEGINSDWEFSSDPYTQIQVKHRKKESTDDNESIDHWSKINKNTIDAKSLFGSDFPNSYSSYNIDSFNLYDHLKCGVNCNVCGSMLK